MDLQRSNFTAPQKILKQENGFAAVVFLTILPVLLAGLFFLLFSQYYLKNWMQSLHICRTELLETQASVGKDLDRLMKLNPQVKALRIALNIAYIQLAAAIAAQNPAAAAAAQARIMQIKQQQRLLAGVQKALIFSANSKMLSGPLKVSRRLREQDQWNQARMPALFSFRTHQIRTFPNTLAVKPDSPDAPPVYELQKDFTQAQALNVSWTSEFQTNTKERFGWIQNHHKLKQNCSASLKDDKGSFPATLNEGKLWSKL